MTMKRKEYTPYEESFLLSGIRIAEDHNYPNAELARLLEPILKRTEKGLEQKIGIMRRKLQNSLLVEQEEPTATLVKTGENKETEKKSIQNATSVSKNGIPIQRVHSTALTEESVPFDEKDVGKVVDVEVVSTHRFGAFCKGRNGQMGLLLKGLITSDFVESVDDYLRIGDQFKVLIIKDKRGKEKTLLNAKAVGDIVPIAER